MVLKLYFDLMSQPSRALYILLKVSKCDFVPIYVNLRKLEHFSSDYTKVNRFQKVPVIDHNGFVLTESVAIMKYLARENMIPENLYPKESKDQARVDEFLEWQHIGLRLHCSMYFRMKHLEPAITGVQPKEHQLSAQVSRMESALEILDTQWLGRGTDFIYSDSPTVADLLAACEVEQPRMAGYDPREKYPNISAWMAKVQNYFNPFYDEAHITLNKVVNKYESVFSKL